jgi:hypothetical protein
VGPVGGKGRPSVGKVEEWYVESWWLQGCSPRLCRLRTNGLAPVSKYWMYRLHAGDMGPLSLVARCQQKLVFSPYLIWCCGRKAGYEPMDQMVIELWIVLGALLLRGSGSVQTCWWLRERLLCMDHTWTKRGMCVACWSNFPLQGVHRFKSPQLSDMSNRLFVIVIT